MVGESPQSDGVCPQGEKYTQIVFKSSYNDSVSPI